MNNMITDSGNIVYYIVKLNGQPLTQPLSSQQLAEMEKLKLDPEIQSLAEVVPVTVEGKQVLFD